MKNCHKQLTSKWYEHHIQWLRWPGLLWKVGLRYCYIINKFITNTTVVQIEKVYLFIDTIYYIQITLAINKRTFKISNSFGKNLNKDYIFYMKKIIRVIFFLSTTTWLQARWPFYTHFRLWVVFIVEDPTVTLKCGTAITTLFLYFKFHRQIPIWCWQLFKYNTVIA